MSDKDIEKLRRNTKSKQVSDYKFKQKSLNYHHGFVYPKDNPLSTGKIEMKYMTAKGRGYSYNILIHQRWFSS